MAYGSWLRHVITTVTILATTIELHAGGVIIEEPPQEAVAHGAHVLRARVIRFTTDRGLTGEQGAFHVVGAVPDGIALIAGHAGDRFQLRVDMEGFTRRGEIDRSFAPTSTVVEGQLPGTPGAQSQEIFAIPGGVAGRPLLSTTVRVRATLTSRVYDLAAGGTGPFAEDIDWGVLDIAYPDGEIPTAFTIVFIDVNNQNVLTIGNVVANPSHPIYLTNSFPGASNMNRLMEYDYRVRIDHDIAAQAPQPDQQWREISAGWSIAVLYARVRDTQMPEATIIRGRRSRVDHDISDLLRVRIANLGPFDVTGTYSDPLEFEALFRGFNAYRPDGFGSETQMNADLPPNWVWWRVHGTIRGSLESLLPDSPTLFITERFEDQNMSVGSRGPLRQMSYDEVFTAVEDPFAP